ncbi:MAG TPA: DAK2 domain-containing protein, partial [Halococcus sp.]|nr:DAK2 domain-containing protein [Halococcus sp.]
PEAVAEPVDGTVLTVISAVAEGLRDTSHEDWEAFLRGGYESGLDALNGTRNAAPGGREVDVVDAGGLGFMLIVRGLFSELAGRAFPFDFSAVNLPARIDHEELLNPIEVQATLRTDDGDSLREDLAALGDSLVLTSDGGQTRLHIHTADPEQVTKVAEGYGSLSNVETTDMRDQLDSLERRLRAAKRAHGSTAETAGTEVIMQADGAGMIRLFEDMDGTVYRDSGELATNAGTDLVLLRIDGLGPAPEALPRECSAVLDVPTMAAALRALVPFSPSRDGEWNMDTMKQAETMIQTDTIHYDESAGFSIRLDGEERISDDADGLIRMLIDRHRTEGLARLTWYVGADAPHGIGRRLRRATREQGLEPTVCYGGQTRDALEFCLE